ncbi:NAC-domain-containing protein [Pseudohyphozyma bogoriensis]|nr:NAC-domain-containing protein [Pseudohyphozyma bogoriensis]
MSDGGLDLDRLRKLQLAGAASRTGGKGVPRRKVIPRAPTGGDDKKLQGALKKLNVQPIQGVEEVNMFKDDNNVLHFTSPKVHAALGSNTFAIYGQGVDKELTELVPGILNQPVGPDAMANLRRIAETYQAQQQAAGAGFPGAGAEKEADDDSDEEPPALVEATPAGGASLEDIN